jgi:hypothetical protein
MQVTKLKGARRIQFIKDPKQRVPYIVEMCYNASWLDAKAENDPEGRTNRDVQIMVRGYLDERVRSY